METLGCYGRGAEPESSIWQASRRRRLEANGTAWHVAWPSGKSWNAWPIPYLSLWGVFSNRRMSLGKSLDGGGGSSFPVWILNQSNSRSRGGGNVGSAPLFFCAFQGREKSLLLGLGIFVFRHFHGPAAGGGKGAKSRRFACCMSSAASVSLRVPAMRCKTAGVSPGRRYCAGWGKANRVSRGV